MKEEKERLKKKEKKSEYVNEKANMKRKKVSGHLIMQMQSIYGNRAVERFYKRKKELEKKKNEKKGDSYSFKIVPIYRFSDGPQVGIRVYQTKMQFHYDHRQYAPKKQKLANSSEKDGTKQTNGEMKALLIGQNRAFALREEQEELLETNEKAKQHFARQMYHPNAPSFINEQIDDKTDSTGEAFETFVQKKIQRGKFSFFSAYPVIVSMIRNKKKEEEINKKKNKVRRKSRISKLKQRFLG